MKSITYSYARSNLAETMDQVCDDHSPVIITRRNGHAVVMFSLEDYHSLEETASLAGKPGQRRQTDGVGVGTEVRRGHDPRVDRVNLVSSENAWQDYLYWQGTDRNILNTINDLIQDISIFLVRILNPVVSITAL